MPTRREFLKLITLAGAGVVLSTSSAFAARSRVASASRAASLPAFIPGGTLDPTSILKYQDQLVIPPAMPRTGPPGNTDYYEIAVRQFQQQILPSGNPTTVWSYGSANDSSTFNYPAFTIEASVNKPVRVKWINELVDGSGNFLPHLLPIDQTLHWANPPGGEAGRDMRPTFTETPGPYLGPVPIVTHLHGAHTKQESDGYPEAWYLPAANDIPAGYAETGTFYDVFKATATHGAQWEPGSAVFEYPNDQRATTLWYHDHTLGITRLNVYAGPAGFYLLRGGPDDVVLDKAGVQAVLPGPAPASGDLPGAKYYEIPIAIQDRSFNADGSLFYPASRAFFDEFAGPYIPESDVSPIWNPEFFGNTMVVNGKTWPYLEVEPRRYRFRFLNGSDSRFLILEMGNQQTFWQIGADGGFLEAPVPLTRLLLGPAERVDVIVDFGGLPVGSEIIMKNLGPDEPFGGGEPGEDFEAADPVTTGQVMKFIVVAGTVADPTTPPWELVLPPITPLGPGLVTRRLSLNEEMSMYPEFDGPVAALLGTVDGDGNPVHLFWHSDVTENPAVGATEVWELYNFTADAHPIHIHQVQFQVLNRQALELDEEGEVETPVTAIGYTRPPELGERGFKDTVIAFPGEVTRVISRFDIPGLFVWHCHILSHEDNEMMRPYRVGPKQRIYLPLVAKQ